MRRALVVLVAAGALTGPAEAALPLIAFSSTGPPNLVAPHRYEIQLEGTGRRELPLPNGVLSPDGRLVARSAGTASRRTIEVAPAAGGAAETISIAAGLPTTIPTIVWAPDSRRLAIAFARGCGGVEGKGITCASYEVWTARVGSPRAVRIARGRLPAWSADSKRLAVVRYAEKFASDAVFVVPADGGVAPLRIVPGTDPVWAPHGSRIAYESLNGLAVVDPARPGQRRILEHAGLGEAPVWSPDGRRIAYVALVATGLNIWPRSLETVDVRTRAVRPLAKVNGDATISLPSWSPDGRRIAYAAGREAANAQVFVVAASGGRPQVVTHEPPWASFDSLGWHGAGRVVYVEHQLLSDHELYAVQPDGSGVVQLTHNRFEDIDPSWSPDGTTIVFQRLQVASGYPRLRQPGIYLLDVATGAERLLVPGSDGTAAPFRPAWSPDGKEIVYTRLSRRVVVVASDGTQVASFPTRDDFPSDPSWSPDGTRIAISVGGSISNEIFVVGRDGTGLRQLTNLYFAVAPAWSRDGRWIACVGDGPGHQHAYWLVSPDGSTTRFLTDGAAFNGAPAWSPDSSELLYFAPDDSLHAIHLDGSSDRVVLRGALLLGMEGPDWRR